MEDNSILSSKEKIDIMLKEYGALRDEINVLTKMLFQLGAVLVGAITWGATRPRDHTFWWGASIVIAGVVLFAAIQWRDMYRASRRIATLEGRINRLAGETLLEWEIGYSPGVKGPFGWLTWWRTQ